MTVGTRSGFHTYTDFCELVGEDKKADLIDGEIYMASPDNTDANDLFLWLICLIKDFVDLRELGKVFGSRVACRLDNKNGPEPDILFVRQSRRHLIKRGHIVGPPDLVIEIVSPGSVERDYEKKRKQYGRFGVSEYWIIDEDLKKVTLLRLDGKGQYREAKPRKGILHSQVLPGFWLRVEWLWRETRPKKFEALGDFGRRYEHSS
jgi:Uma2 family endonuclease